MDVEQEAETELSMLDPSTNALDAPVREEELTHRRKKEYPDPEAINSYSHFILKQSILKDKMKLY